MPSVLAQLTITPRAASVKVGGRIHVQYTRSSADGDDGAVGAVDDVFIRRARINVGDVFNARVAPDFGDGEAKVAFADI